jgi:hypothetical protein
MPQLLLSKIKPAEVKSLINIQEHGIAPYRWLQTDAIALQPIDQQRIQDLQTRLLNERTLLMNEATVWARAIYPLLLLAEHDSIQAHLCAPKFQGSMVIPPRLI